MPKPIPIIGHGKPWHVRIAPRLKNDWGWCNWTDREIVLSKEAEKEGIDREVLIHELLHKAMPFMREECIDLMAHELDEALEVCGY